MKLNKLSAIALTLTALMTTTTSAYAAQDSAEQKDVSAEKTINLNDLKKVSDGVYVIEDKNHTFMVPNVSIILGEKAAMIVDTGLSVESAKRVLQEAKKLAGDKKLYLTLTHFHPEHGFGAQVFKDKATIIYNRSQYEELQKKGPAFRKLFAEHYNVAAAMKEVKFVKPDVLYDGQASIDLGGRTVKLNYYGPAHTLGDQVISVPDQGVYILGDLLETESFPIMPWFPEMSETDVDPENWRTILHNIATTKPTVVVPGHGPVGTAADINALIHHMDKATAEVKTLCANGVGIKDIQKQVTPLLIAQQPTWLLQDWIPMELQADYAHLCGNQ
ncbi:MBL fold metallo-hydrolase [Marinomonas pollencensis]|uniref:Glyoxylase-like metal-dependent hydrolase (Beta-lactamase superfamily II) n=1 Tax=Marinomonas pollencensis TaxID=491954 RepID=A0A3E0DX18_9GAMM|nr:MBL fold metallo-hydrolase [Marinomonas pollencensis]REG86631.1 glyoxylase-like metal-dependent hydrolase (beta-lactamase superfamily II) [Marinomonas pollencensis]